MEALRYFEIEIGPYIYVKRGLIIVMEEQDWLEQWSELNI